MKLKTLFLSGCLMLIFGIGMAQAQEKFTLTIQDIEIIDNGKTIKIDSSITQEIYLDKDNKILIYQNDKYKYYTTITMARSGNRIKVVEQNVITDINNQFVTFGTQRKQVQFINIGMPGKFQNTSGEYLLIDKKTYASIKASFTRIVSYGPNQQ
ncbi:MAG: hypothetical protein U0U66_12050 [Cytophagaceae bacterium]